MRIVRYRNEQNRVQLGIELDNNRANVLEGDLFGYFQTTGKVEEICSRLSPIEPKNIFCIGLNYKQHAKEMNLPIPQEPVVFMKPTSSLNHPDHPIQIPVCSKGDEMDYECELAIVIGQKALNVSKENALDYVLGYTIANDVSARIWQKTNGGQWIRAKGFDGFCPIGPVLVTKDEILNPQSLSIKTYVNGQIMQDSHTSDMVFDVASIISFLSQSTTLYPNTLILTGTPSGVGVGRKPPIFLKAGDSVVIEIEKIGQLKNTITL